MQKKWRPKAPFFEAARRATIFSDLAQQLVLRSSRKLVVRAKDGLHSTEGRHADHAVREHRTTQGEERRTVSTWEIIRLLSHWRPLDETVGEVGWTARDRFRVE